MELETKRKLIHISGAVFPFYILWAERKWTLAVPVATLAALIFALYFVSCCFKRNIRLPVVSKIIETTERPDVIENTPGKGAMMFLIGALLSLLIFSNVKIACASILILALGDGVSTIVGVKVGRHKIFYNRAKSWEGTLAGFALALAGALALVPYQIALAGSLAGMFIESLPLKIDDNFSMPLFSAFAMSMAFYLF